MRLFLTVNMSSDVREELAVIVPKIRSKYSKGRWVPRENWHITMLFLGEVEENRLADIEKVMSDSISGISPFNLWIEGIGGFPNNKKANILWAGVKGETEKLNQLYQQLVRTIAKTDLPYDAKEKYSPHVTLARKIFESVDNETVLRTEEWSINGLELYQSIFAEKGVVYKRIISKTF